MTFRALAFPFLRTVLVFILLGPLVGTFCILALVMLVGVVGSLFSGSGSSLAGLAFFATMGLVFGYALGFIPAAVTGVVCHLFSRRVARDLEWVAACAGAGALVTYGFGMMHHATALAPLGAVSAAACAWVLRRWRWT